MDKIIKFIFESCDIKGINLKYNTIEDINYEMITFFNDEFSYLISAMEHKSKCKLDLAEDEALDLNDLCLSRSGFSAKCAYKGVYNLMTKKITVDWEDISGY